MGTGGIAEVVGDLSDALAMIFQKFLRLSDLDLMDIVDQIPAVVLLEQRREVTSGHVDFSGVGVYQFVVQGVDLVFDVVGLVDIAFRYRHLVSNFSIDCASLT